MDIDLGQVQFKRMIPCAQVFMKRRRAQDYKCVLKDVYLKSAANDHNLNFDIERVMIDFEIEVKIAFERSFPQ